MVRTGIAIGGRLVALAALWTAMCAPLSATPQADVAGLAIVNRLSWGVTPTAAADLSGKGIDRWIDEQLRMPSDVRLPADVQRHIDQMRISRETVAGLVAEIAADQTAKNALTDIGLKRAAQEALQKKLEDLYREAQDRSLLRDVYSPAQLREQMTWFWCNHFNVFARKDDVRAMVGDYEDKAVRPLALGRFRDLIEATLRHPAMLNYLDNNKNAVHRVNENYAREIMELHTMGVGSGYTQRDVEELARILTGVGIYSPANPPKLRPEMQPLYIRDGLFEFNPQRHDFGTKTFLGHEIRGQGFGEVEQALDLIARSPATARHVSERIATFFMGDNPPAALVQRMAATFMSKDGDISATLRTMTSSAEFRASLGHTFKDPVHYVISSLRLAFDGRPIANTDVAIAWLTRMGEGLFGRQTPDGYPLGAAAWIAPGQMGYRFEFARQIGNGAPKLFNPRGAAPSAAPAAVPPVLQNSLYSNFFARQLAPATRAALNQAGNPSGWNSLFLSSPEFMRR